MHLLENLRRKWGGLRDEERRELDERQRLLRLLAARDGFVALVVLTVSQMVLQMYFARDSGTPPIRNLALLPLYAIALAMLVVHLSLRLRGGGLPGGVAAFRVTITAGSVITGLLIGWLVNTLLASTDVVAPLPADWWVGYLFGLLIIVPIVFLLLRRRRPPDQ